MKKKMRKWRHMFEDAEQDKTSDQPVPTCPGGDGEERQSGNSGDSLEEVDLGKNRLSGSPAKPSVPTMSLERGEASMQPKPSSTVADCDMPEQYRVPQADQSRVEFLGFLWIKILDTVPLDLDALGVEGFIKKGGCLPFLGVAWDPKDDSVLFGAPPVDADLTVAKLESSAMVHRAELMFEMPATVERFHTNLEPVSRVAKMLLGQNVGLVETFSAEGRNEAIGYHFEVPPRQCSIPEVDLVRLGRRSDPPLFLHQLDPFIGSNRVFRISGCIQKEDKPPDPSHPPERIMGGTSSNEKPLTGSPNQSSSDMCSDVLPLQH